MSSQKPSLASKPKPRLLRRFVTLVILMIFAAYFLPLYADYRGRTRVAEGLLLASGPKAAIAEFYAQTGQWPEGNQDEKRALLGLTNKPISGIAVQDINILSAGMIEIIYTNDSFGENRKIVLVPHYIGSKQLIRWSCLNPSENGFKNLRNLPVDCR